MSWAEGVVAQARLPSLLTRTQCDRHIGSGEGKALSSRKVLGGRRALFGRQVWWLGTRKLAESSWEETGACEEFCSTQCTQSSLSSVVRAMVL